MSVSESSDDNLRPAIAEPCVHPQGWFDAFDAQCNEALLKRLRRYALLLARLPGGEHLGDPAAYAEELVQAVMADVIAGVLRWDPVARELEPSLIDMIRLRVRRDRRRAARYTYLSLDAAYSDDAAFSAQVVEASLVASDSSRNHDGSASLAGTLFDDMRPLRALAAADPLALRFLGAIDHGATTRAEIMRVAQLTRGEYYNARRRLGRLLAQINPGQHKPRKDN